MSTKQTVKIGSCRRRSFTYAANITPKLKSQIRRCFGDISLNITKENLPLLVTLLREEATTDDDGLEYYEVVIRPSRGSLPHGKSDLTIQDLVLSSHNVLSTGIKIHLYRLSESAKLDLEYERWDDSDWMDVE